MEVKVGSKWRSNDKMYVVVSTYVDDNGHEWVHYREDGCSDCKEYSCWTESFVSRFSLYTNYQ